MTARTDAVSGALGSVGGNLVKTSSVTTMVMAEKKVMSPPQMRMEMRAQLRRRRMFAPTKIPKMASASKNSQKMLVMARTDSGKGAPLLSEEMRETACMAI